MISIHLVLILVTALLFALYETVPMPSGIKTVLAFAFMLFFLWTLAGLGVGTFK